MDDVKEIDEIIFGLFSAKEIIDMSVCKVDTTKLTGNGSVYDERMGGNTDNNIPCVTCGQTPKNCPGHFGHIEFNEYIIHPLFYKQVVAFLRCFCIQCNRLLITADQVAVCGLLRYVREMRFKKIIEKLEKVDICCHCSHPQPKIAHSITDNTISMVYKEKVVEEENNDDSGEEKTTKKIVKKDSKISIAMSIDEIKKTLDAILDEDVILCGFAPERVHPRNFIMSVFPVIPPCFTEDTIVYTNNGYKFIKNVLDTDKLYTHTGKFQSINERHITKYTKSDMVEVDIVYHPHSIKCTPEHPFYVRNIILSADNNKKIIGDPKWIPALELTNNSFVGMKRNTNNNLPYFTVENGEIFCLSNILEWFLLGYFTKNGCLDFVNKGYFSLVYHIRDEDIIVKIIKKLGITTTITNKNHRYKTLECYNFIYWHILKEFYNENNDKKIPQWVQDSPVNFVEEYINSYIYNRNRLQFITDSKDIAFSMQLLFLKIGKICKISYNKIYTLRVDEQKDDLSILLEKDYIWYNVFSKKDIFSTKDILVYNFDVGTDHTYCVENVIVHNCARPFVLADGNICDDDLTNQILEIIKANNILKPSDDTIPDEKRETKKQKALQSLKFRVLTLFNNSQGKAKHPTNGRPIKGLKERMTGKEGQIRNNLMGKRVEFSGRTVIGPDPKLKFGEMGVPKQIAEELTIPERVTVFNKEYLSKLVNNDKANFVMKNEGDTRINLKYAMFRKGTELLYGDVVIRGEEELPVINNNVVLQNGDKVRRDGKILKGLKNGDIIIRKDERLLYGQEGVNIRYGDNIERDGKNIPYSSILTYPSKKRVALNIGDVVHRHLKNGDVILLNRQPTLHKGSMLAKKIRVMPGKTFRMNLDTCKTFNADFDGDEMNIHVPQSLESRAELEFLSATKHNIISAQASKPNIAIVQDSLLAAFLMTKQNLPITKSQFFDISLSGDINGRNLWSLERVKTIREVLKLKGKKPTVYNGRGLISLILPEDFIYDKKNDAHPDEPYIRIYRGVLYEGALDKNILGASHNSIIQVLNKEYGYSTAADFISNIQFVTNSWLLQNGFSIGLQDCLITSPESVIKIQDKISRCYVEAEGIELATHNPGIREVRITAALNKAKDVGMKIAKDSMSEENNLLSTVHSGSKGDFFNIAQLTGLLGQQNLLGKRVLPTLNHGKRTLPHYSFEKMEKEDEYESRGFVRHSFIEGLTPQEYFFHAMSGREGICDTAMGTAKSGYIQRRIIKCCEDIQIKYDGSVRDTTGNVYQMSYGDNGFDPCSTVKVGNSQEPCDVTRMVARLNLQHEMNSEKNSEMNKKEQVTVTKPKISRIFLLKELAKKTGVKCLYKGLSIEELTKRLAE
jgi:DNA-directed RNA polymerase beta' subunit